MGQSLPREAVWGGAGSLIRVRVGPEWVRASIGVVAMVISALTYTEEQEAAERKEVRITTTATAVVKTGGSESIRI